MAVRLEKSLYVVDLLSRAEKAEETLEIYQKSRRIMVDRGFNLRKLFPKGNSSMVCHCLCARAGFKMVGDLNTQKVSCK